MYNPRGETLQHVAPDAIITKDRQAKVASLSQDDKCKESGLQSRSDITNKAVQHHGSVEALRYVSYRTTRVIAYRR